MAETRMIASDKTRELKRQCNDQDDGPGTKRLSFTRLFVFPILCGHDTLLYPGVDYLVTTVAGRPALVCGENHTWHFIRVGTIRQRNELPPKVQIWTRSAQPWVEELASVPRIEKQ
jgi:hypothetical protein